MNRAVYAIVSAVVAVLTALVMYLVLRAPTAPAPDVITIEQATRWTYDRDGVWIGDLTISSDNKNLPVTAPGISARIRNDTDDRMIVALHVVLLDENGELVAAECLSNPPAGLIKPGEEKIVAVMLQVPSMDIARVKHIRLRVTRAAVHRMKSGGTV